MISPAKPSPFTARPRTYRPFIVFTVAILGLLANAAIRTKPGFAATSAASASPIGAAKSGSNAKPFKLGSPPSTTSSATATPKNPTRLNGLSAPRTDTAAEKRTLKTPTTPNTLNTLNTLNTPTTPKAPTTINTSAALDATNPITATSAAAATPSKPLSELLIAGASDLRPAFEELGKLFTAQTGTKVTFSFGSSGQLAQQLTNGAPFDVFASADKTYIDEVLANGIGDPTTKATYAFGRLALWVPAATQKRIFNVLDLSDPSIQRIAIANPEHAPYGVAAKQALQSANIYELVADKLVYGENVSDTYRLATSGNADAALVSLSLVIANRNGGRYVIVPTDAHAPLEQALMVTAKKSRASSAKAFVSLVTGTSGRSVMRKFGFLLPGDPKPLNDNG
jgi:molybdate transport system substrate-binding protein